MFKFVRKPKGKTGDDANASLRIEVVGGLPDHPAQVLEYTADNGRRVVVRGGLPDLLEGEPEGQQRIMRGTSTVQDDHYLIEPLPIAAESEAEA